MKLIATKTLIYGGKRIGPGDEFTAARQSGKVLVAIGKARIATPEPTVAELEEVVKPAVEKPTVEAEEKPKRTYKRRDMKVENESEG